jgi:hypothetical protein
MLDYAPLDALDAAVSHGSFDRAAREFNVTPSAVSQRVKSLEKRMIRTSIEPSELARVVPGAHVDVDLRMSIFFRRAGGCPSAGSTISGPCCKRARAHCPTSRSVPRYCSFVYVPTTQRTSAAPLWPRSPV